jgi:hypothetical protein
MIAVCVDIELKVRNGMQFHSQSISILSRRLLPFGLNHQIHQRREAIARCRQEQLQAGTTHETLDEQQQALSRDRGVNGETQIRL